MLIQNFGLFWRASEIDWHPGAGNRTFRLLGRRGIQKATVELADFRSQQGIYILYGEYGAHYVGLTKTGGLGARLKQHLSDHLEDKWDRFSWFGFRGLLKPAASTGIRPLKPLPTVSLGAPTDAIADMEALLIKAMGPTNKQKMNFRKAKQWLQVDEDEVDEYLGKVLR